MWEMKDASQLKLLSSRITHSFWQMLVKSLLLLALTLNRSYAVNIKGPLSQDFQNWLQSNGYRVEDFTRPDFQANSIEWASYGGKVSPSDPVSLVQMIVMTAKDTFETSNPVIFVHGNSDSALANPNALDPAFATGWDASMKYFISQGYAESQLYATTWGPADSAQAGNQIHSCDYLNQLRQFFQVLLRYFLTIHSWKTLTGSARLHWSREVGHNLSFNGSDTESKSNSGRKSDGQQRWFVWSWTSHDGASRYICWHCWWQSWPLCLQWCLSFHFAYLQYPGFINHSTLICHAKTGLF